MIQHRVLAAAFFISGVWSQNRPISKFSLKTQHPPDDDDPAFLSTFAPVAYIICRYFLFSPSLRPPISYVCLCTFTHFPISLNGRRPNRRPPHNTSRMKEENLPNSMTRFGKPISHHLKTTRGD